MRYFVLIIGFILAGITLEVFWTSILDYKKTRDLRLPGKSYLWMFPIYGVAPIIFVFGLKYFANYSIFLRALFYMLAFYILEYISGYIIRKLIGRSPWDYSVYSIKLFGRKFNSNLHGVICLEYGPVWYVYGILGEYYFLFLTQIS